MNRKKAFYLARGRAWAALARRHHAEYAALVEREMAALGFADYVMAERP